MRLKTLRKVVFINWSDWTDDFQELNQRLPKEKKLKKKIKDYDNQLESLEGKKTIKIQIFRQKRKKRSWDQNLEGKAQDTLL
jgi:hypothetical protein